MRHAQRLRRHPLNFNLTKYRFREYEHGVSGM
jgi:hypothetical protein